MVLAEANRMWFRQGHKKEVLARAKYGSSFPWTCGSWCERLAHAIVISVCLPQLAPSTDVKLIVASWCLPSSVLFSQEYTVDHTAWLENRNLAVFGRKELRFAENEEPGVCARREAFGLAQPCKSFKIS